MSGLDIFLLCVAVVWCIAILIFLILYNGDSADIPLNYANDIEPLNAEEIIEEEEEHICNYGNCKCEPSCKNKEKNKVVVPKDEYIQKRIDVINPQREPIIASAATIAEDMIASIKCDTQYENITEEFGEYDSYSSHSSCDHSSFGSHDSEHH